MKLYKGIIREHYLKIRNKKLESESIEIYFKFFLRYFKTELINRSSATMKFNILEKIYIG